jgi:hypothetical protein
MSARAPDRDASAHQVGARLAHREAMSRALRECDWASTALGPRAQWPAPLEHTVDLAMQADAAMLVAWGDEMVTIANGAVAELVGVPAAAHLVGAPLARTWPALASVVDHVRTTREPCERTIVAPGGAPHLDVSCSAFGDDGVFVLLRASTFARGDAAATAITATAAVTTPATLMELGIALDASRTLDEVVDVMTHAASEIVGADVAVTTLAGNDPSQPPHSSVVADGQPAPRGRDRPMMGAAMVSPAGERLGLIQVAGRRAGGNFDEDDLDRLVQLAQLAAARIEHFRNYLRAENIATELQHRLLPEALPHTDGVAAAAASIAGRPTWAATGTTSCRSTTGRGW